MRGSSVPTEPIRPPEPNETLVGGGETGARMRAIDWSSTALGPVSRWPQPLKTCVRIILTSRQPMWLGWGADLIYFHNDACTVVLADKHPQALGQPTAVVWHEIWDHLGPRIKTTLESAEGSYDEAFFAIMERHGYREETYFTFSLSPIPDDDGGVGGILCTMNDDTRRIVGERRLALLSELGTRTAGARTVAEAYTLSAQALATDPRDLPFALIYRLTPGRPYAERASTTPIAADHPSAPDVLPLVATIPWPVADVLRTNASYIISNLDPSLDAISYGAWDRLPNQAILMPIQSLTNGDHRGLLIAGLNPYRPFDEDDQRFLELITNQIAAAIGNAGEHEEERRRAEALSELDNATWGFLWNVNHAFRTALVGATVDTQRPSQPNVRSAQRALLEAVTLSTVRRDVDAELSADLAAMTHLHALSTRVLESSDLVPLLREVLESVINVQGADFGNMQLVNPKTGALEIVVQQGFEQPFLDYFGVVEDAAAACGRAFQKVARIIIDDVEVDPDFAPHREIAAASGFRAVQSTPLVDRAGLPLGMLSTHFRQPHRPTDRELRLTDLYARLAVESIVHKRAEDALLESEIRFRTIANLVPDLLWINDPAGSAQWFNQRILEYTGYAMNDLLGDGWLNVIHPDDVDSTWRNFRNGVSAGHFLRQEYRIRRADGTYRWFQEQGVPVHDETGQIVQRFGVATDIHEQRATRDALEARVQSATAELHALSRQLLQIQEAERHRLARELHDEIGQALTGLSITLALARQTGEDTLLEQAMTISDDLLHQVREISLDLRPAVLDDIGLAPAILSLIERYSARTGVQVELRQQGLDRRFATDVETAAYRIIQEALTNVARHAEIDRASVQILADSHLSIWVSDAGRGFDPAIARADGISSGLAGMAERVHLAGGRISIESTPGEGTLIAVELPAEPASAHLEE